EKARLGNIAATSSGATNQIIRDVISEQNAIKKNNWNLSQKIKDAEGLHTTVLTDEETGAQKFYLHDMKNLNDSNLQLSISTAGVFATSDKGATWYGMDFSGDMIARLLQTEVIQSPDGLFVIDFDNKSIKLGDELLYQNGRLTFGANVSLGWENITGADDLATKDYVDSAISESGGMTSDMVTQITRDTVTTTFIKALNLTVGNEIQMGPNAVITWDQVTGIDDIATKDYVSQVIVEAGGMDENAVTIIARNEIASATITGNQIRGNTITSLDGKSVVIDLENNAFNLGNSLIWDGYDLTLGKDVYITWEQVTGTEDVPTKEEITTISRNEISTANISASQITTGKLECENLEITGLVVGGNVTMGKDVTLTWQQITGTDNVANKGD
ncbi:MAG: hypothetical protein MJ139_06660, partial [Limosilactobacillus sp.]|nr:hypothetical protein [Limosilactobacillus sp.]